MNRPACVVAALLLILTAARLPAAEDPRIAQVRADWLARRAATHDVMYKLEGESLTLKHSDFKPGDPEAPPGAENGFPLEDTTRPFQMQWFFDFDRSQFRVEKQADVMYVMQLEYKPRYIIEGYDGQRMWTNVPDAADATEELVLQKADRANWIFSDEERVLFFAHGIFPFGMTDFAQLERQTTQRLDLRLVGEAKIEGHDCLVLTVGGHGENVPPRVYIDPSRQSAILRMDLFFDFSSGGVPIVPTDILADQVDISYAQVQGLWLPDGWKSSYFALSRGADGNTTSVFDGMTTWNVVQVSLNTGLEPELFRQPRRAGQYVSDAADNSLYQVADDGTTLIKTSRRQLEHAAPPPDRNWVWGVLGGVGLIAAGLLAVRFGFSR